MTPRALLTQASRAGHQMVVNRSGQRLPLVYAVCLNSECYATLTVRLDGTVLDASAANEQCAANPATVLAASKAIRTAI